MEVSYLISFLSDGLGAMFGVLLTSVVLFMFRKHLSYRATIGMNLATKKDISEITEKMESVKIIYKGYDFRYKKEYEILYDFSALLVDLKDATLGLRPVSEHRDPTKSEDEIKSEKLINYYDKWWALYPSIERKRPFYSNDVYTMMNKIVHLAHNEAVEYRRLPRPLDSDSGHKYWKSADKNREEMEVLIEQTLEQIRSQVVCWSDLNNRLENY